MALKANYVTAFAEGNGTSKTFLGGKGAIRCEMTRIGLNVPTGFVITTGHVPYTFRIRNTHYSCLTVIRAQTLSVVKIILTHTPRFLYLSQTKRPF